MDFGDLLTFILKIQTLVDDKDFDGAEKLVDELLVKYPDMPMLLFTKALCLDAKGEFGEAFEYCRRAREIDEGIVPDEFYNAAEYKAKNSPKAKRREKHSEKRKIPSLLDSGVNLIERQEYNKAKHFFERVLGIDEDNLEAFVARAYCLNRLGMLSESRRLTKCIDRYELDPKFLHFFDEIRAIEAEDARPDHESLKEVRQLCDEGFKNIAEYRIRDAKICFNKALKIDENDANPVIGNAYCLYHLGYYVLALKECRKAIDMDVESVDRKFYRKVKAKASEV